MTDRTLPNDDLNEILREAKEFLSKRLEGKTESYCYDFNEDRPKTGGQFEWQTDKPEDFCVQRQARM